MRQHVLDTIDPRVLGQRLQDARRARRLTQQEVAGFLAVARTTVTALEKGDRRIRPDELVRLANLYGRAVSDFVGSREPMANFAVQFRTAIASAGTAPAQSELEQSVQDFQSLCEDYLYLERLNGLPYRHNYPAQYPIDGVAPENAAADVAASERNRLGLGDGPILHLRETLENDVDIRIFYTELPSRVAGVFAYTEDLGGCIGVNVRHPEERRRWTMAHEYAHFLTSRFRSEITMLGGAYERVPAHERFADAFARSMLMPATGLRRRFNEAARASESRVTAAEVCRIAHYYFVSVEAMMLRLEELQLLPRGAWERLRDRGFKVGEAREELGLIPHQHDAQLLPVRYQLLAVRSYEEGNLTEGELSRLLRTDRVSARRVVQKLTHPVHILEEGSVTSLSINLASDVSGQDS